MECEGLPTDLHAFILRPTKYHASALESMDQCGTTLVELEHGMSLEERAGAVPHFPPVLCTMKAA